MIYFDAVDFRYCRSEEVISFFWIWNLNLNFFLRSVKYSYDCRHVTLRRAKLQQPLFSVSRQSFYPYQHFFLQHGSAETSFFEYNRRHLFPDLDGVLPGFANVRVPCTDQAIIPRMSLEAWREGVQG